MNDATQFFDTTAAGGYAIERSLRFNSSDSAYLSRTPASAGNRKTWTWAAWVKRSRLGVRQALFAGHTGGAGNYNTIEFITGDSIVFFFNGTAGGPTTAALFRDPSAWMHVCVALDTTQATASNRVKIYVNGVQQSIASGTYPTQNADLQINATSQHDIGVNGGYDWFNGLLADVFFIDGQALGPSSFTEVSATTGQLIPKQYTGSFGTNGFWLKFSDNSAATATTLGKDYSSNGNNWTPNNLSVTAGAGNDSLVDTPTSYGTDDGLGGSVRGNYCTWNPLIKSTYASISNGNLDIVSSNNHGQTLGTIGVSSGKWYWEVAKSTSGNPATAGLGVMQQEYKQDAAWAGNGVGRSYIYLQGGTVFWYDGTGSGGFGNTSLANDTGIWMFALDLDAQKMWVGKNGTWYSNTGSTITGPSSGLNAFFTNFVTGGTYFPFHNSDSTAVTYVANFGQRPFAYTAPSGFKALCDTNLPAPVVAQPSTVMDVKLYTGNGSTQTISGLGFSPDLVWIKARSNAANHALIDSVRGASLQLSSSSTAVEATDANGVTSLDSNGFSLGTATLGYSVNTNAYTYAAWNWDAGSSTVTNTQGSITSQVRANPSAGFSIVSFVSGSTSSYTVGHGLGVTPEFMIFKDRDTAGQPWTIYHKSLGSSQYLLFSTAAAASASWGGSPTSSVFYGSTTFFVSSKNIIGYCFAPVAGYSAFGSYTGNGSADGPFVYTGFRPRWVMLKTTTESATGATGWHIFDAARLGYNGSATNKGLRADTSAVEVNPGDIDILSSGFKLRTNNSGLNTSAATYIYAAFAESPFQYARAR